MSFATPCSPIGNPAVGCNDVIDWKAELDARSALVANAHWLISWASPPSHSGRDTGTGTGELLEPGHMPARMPVGCQFSVAPNDRSESAKGRRIPTGDNLGSAYGEGVSYTTLCDIIKAVTPQTGM